MKKQRINLLITELFLLAFLISLSSCLVPRSTSAYARARSKNNCYENEPFFFNKADRDNCTGSAAIYLEKCDGEYRISSDDNGIRNLVVQVVLDATMNDLVKFYTLYIYVGNARDNFLSDPVSNPLLASVPLSNTCNDKIISLSNNSSKPSDYDYLYDNKYVAHVNCILNNLDKLTLEKTTVTAAILQVDFYGGTPKFITYPIAFKEFTLSKSETIEGKRFTNREMNIIHYSNSGTTFESNISSRLTDFEKTYYDLWRYSELNITQGNVMEKGNIPKYLIDASGTASLIWENDYSFTDPATINKLIENSQIYLSNFHNEYLKGNNSPPFKSIYYGFSPSSDYFNKIGLVSIKDYKMVAYDEETETFTPKTGTFNFNGVYLDINQAVQSFIQSNNDIIENGVTMVKENVPTFNPMVIIYRSNIEYSTNDIYYTDKVELSVVMHELAHAWRVGGLYVNDPTTHTDYIYGENMTYCLFRNVKGQSNPSDFFKKRADQMKFSKGILQRLSNSLCVDPTK